MIPSTRINLPIRWSWNSPTSRPLAFVSLFTITALFAVFPAPSAAQLPAAPVELVVQLAPSIANPQPYAQTSWLLGEVDGRLLLGGRVPGETTTDWGLLEAGTGDKPRLLADLGVVETNWGDFLIEPYCGYGEGSEDLIYGTARTTQCLAAEGRVYVAVDRGSGGTVFWSSDGSLEGTWPVYQGGSTSMLATLGDDLLFYRDEGDLTGGPWLTDGTATGTGPVLIANRPQQLGSAGPLGRTVVLGNDRALWMTKPPGVLVVDRTSRSGRFLDVAVPTGSSFFTPQGQPRGKGFWRRPVSSTQDELMVTDGTDAGTRSLGVFDGSLSQSRAMAAGADGMTFILRRDNGWEAWFSDGSPSGTRRLGGSLLPSCRDLIAWPSMEVGSQVRTVLGCEQSDTGIRLFSIDTATGLGAEITPAAVGEGRLVLWSTRPNQVLRSVSERGLAVGATIRLGSSQRSGYLFSDGTAAGTVFDSRWSSPSPDYGVASFHGELYFLTAPGNDRNRAHQVVRTDGALDRFRVLFEVPADRTDVRIGGLFATGGALTFDLIDPAAGTQIFSTDGTANGTRPLTRGTQVVGARVGPQFRAGEDLLFFAAPSAGAASELWYSSGAQAATRKLREFPSIPLRELPPRVTQFGDFFLLGEASQGPRVHHVGAASEFLLHERLAFDQIVEPFGLGNRLIFRGQQASGGPQYVYSTTGLLGDRPERLIDIDFVDELYRSMEGVFLQEGVGLIVLKPVASSSGLRRYFLTNGRRSGTREIPHFAISGGKFAGAVLPGASFHIAAELPDDFDLLRGDGLQPLSSLRSLLPEDAFRVSILGGHESRIYLELSRSLPQFGTSVWVTDGTAQGTREVLDVSRRRDFESISWLGHAEFGDLLVGTGNRSTQKESVLWSFDPQNGQRRILGYDYLLRRIAGAGPASFVQKGPNVFFVSQNLRAGAEVWVTNGTREGTRVIADVAPGPLSSEPELLDVVGGKLLFHAWNPEVGRQLWSVPVPTMLEKQPSAAGPAGDSASEEGDPPQLLTGRRSNHSSS